MWQSPALELIYSWLGDRHVAMLLAMTLHYIECDDKKRKPPLFLTEVLCSRYLSSQAVTRQVLSAYMSLTSVFGMGTGGPSWQSTRTLWMAFNHLFISKLFQAVIPLVTHTGFEPMLTAWEAAVLTTWPMGHGAPSGTRTRDPLIKSQLLYQLS